mmetsp:Transcript_100603/g.289060  ORF Transcript_100603/g.289060 Transcript_100603/m.289060 type:complete len:314 (-) Transcript_100603:287-1228(-)
MPPAVKAAFKASLVPNVTKANFFRSPVIGSFGVWTSNTGPNCENTSRIDSAGTSLTLSMCTFLSSVPIKFSLESMTDIPLACWSVRILSRLDSSAMVTYAKPRLIMLLRSVAILTASTRPYLAKYPRKSSSEQVSGKLETKYFMPSSDPGGPFFPAQPLPHPQPLSPPQPPLSPPQPIAPHWPQPPQPPPPPPPQQSKPLPPHMSPFPPLQPFAGEAEAGLMSVDWPLSTTLPISQARLKASSDPKVTKPNFFRSPVFGSLGVCTSQTCPNWLKASRISSAVRCKTLLRWTFLPSLPTKLSFVNSTRTPMPPR